MAKIEIREFPTMPQLALEGWDPNGCSGDDYGTPRAAALYEALGISQNDEEYALARHADGRWALIGLTVEGHQFAIEVPEEVADLIPAVVKVDEQGKAITNPSLYRYPRSLAYEERVKPLLRRGWKLYSEHAVERGNADHEPVLGRDWGAFFADDTGDTIASVHGVRNADGSPRCLRAWVSRRGNEPARSGEFPAGDIAIAAGWCDAVMCERARVIVRGAEGGGERVSLQKAISGMSAEDNARVRYELLRATKRTVIDGVRVGGVVCTLDYTP